MNDRRYDGKFKSLVQHHAAKDGDAFRIPPGVLASRSTIKRVQKARVKKANK